MASTPGNLDALLQLHSIRDGLKGFGATADQNGAFRQALVGVALPGAPAGVTGASLGCYRYLPRSPGSALQVTCPRSFGIGLDPLKSGPGVVLGISFDVAGSTKQASMMLRPGDWLDVPAGFTSFSIFAADGADLYQSVVTRFPLGYVSLVLGLAVGTRPYWTTGPTPPPVKYANVLASAVVNLSGAGSFLVNAPRTGRARIHCVMLDNVNVPLSGLFSLDWQVQSLMPLVNSAGAWTADSMSGQTLDSPFPTAQQFKATTFYTHGGNSVASEVVGDVGLSAGLNLLSVLSGVVRLIDGSPGVFNVWAWVEWLGSEAPSDTRNVTIFDTTSVANTAQAAILCGEDFDQINIVVKGSAAMAGAPTVTISEVADSGGTLLPIFGQAIAATSVVAALPFGIGVTGAPGFTGTANGNNVRVPRFFRVDVGAAGVGITTRLIITGRRVQGR